MAGKAKFTEVMSVIKRRIREGDYLLDTIPGERKIAEETHVSYMTARRAVVRLLEEEVLIRGPSGALDVHPKYAERARLAETVLLYPAYPSTYLTQLRSLVVEHAQNRGIGLRPAQFVHWDERTVVDAVEQARGTIVIPHGPDIPPRLVKPLRSNKVVILDGDFTNSDVPSIRLFSDGSIERVFMHLYRLGHRHIDCLNTQCRNLEIERRIDIWNRCRVHGGLTGRLWDHPAAVFADPTAAGYELMSRLVDGKQSAATAFLATTCPAAMGAIRACWERGLKVGKDVSICSVNIEHPAQFYCPAITGLHTPDLSDVLDQCFAWFLHDQNWQGPMLLEPKKSRFFRGESTARCP